MPPKGIACDPGVAVIENGTGSTTRLTAVVRVNAPLFPVMVRVYDPEVGQLSVSVEVCVGVAPGLMAAGSSVGVPHPEGEMLALRATVPLKTFKELAPTL